MKLAHWLALTALVLPGRVALAGSDCRTWTAAMSIPLSKELSPERLKELKQAGIDAVEFGLTPVNTPAAAAAHPQPGLPVGLRSASGGAL